MLRVLVSSDASYKTPPKDSKIATLPNMIMQQIG